MGSSSSSSSSRFFLLLLVVLFMFISSSSLFLLPSSPPTDSPLSLSLERPSVDVTPSAVSATDLPGRSGKESLLLCKRVEVSCNSRLKLGSFSSAVRVMVVPSVVIPERLHGRIQVCFHRNASLGLCQCEKSEWKGIEKGLWSSVMSPYDTRYVDVKVVGEVPGSISVAIDEEPQRWRLLCLGVGFLLLLLAPVVCGWVPFYYSSSMAIGIIIVIIILLFQGMKLLPTGRKSALYLTLYGSMLGAGSFLLHQFSMMVNSILANFGLSEEMYNPVYVFLVLGILIAGAALGYWMVRKFVISEDGDVDVGVAQFVKWSMRVIAATIIFQSTLDSFLALVALACCWFICSLITSAIWWDGEAWNSQVGKWENHAVVDVLSDNDRNIIPGLLRMKQPFRFLGYNLIMSWIPDIASLIMSGIPDIASLIPLTEWRHHPWARNTYEIEYFPIIYLQYDAHSFIWNSYPGWSKKTTMLHNRAEFLAKSPIKGFRSPGKGFQSTRKGFLPPGRGGFQSPGNGSQGKTWNRSKRSDGWSDSPVKGIISPASSESRDGQTYYSVLHKQPNRKRFTEEEWEESKSQWTREAMSDLVSSPEFTDWIIEHADRIRVSSGDSSDEEVCSNSDSTDAAPLNSGSWFGLLNLW